MGVESEWIAGQILTRLNEHCRKPPVGWVIGSRGTSECLAGVLPDTRDRLCTSSVSFVSKSRLPKLPTGHIKIVPDLVVEVISPNDLYADVDAKVDEYLLVGVKLVWVVNPFTKSLRIYRLDGTSQTLREDDELSGEDVVPGFRCRLTDFLTSLDDE